MFPVEKIKILCILPFENNLNLPTKFSCSNVQNQHQVGIHSPCHEQQ